MGIYMKALTKAFRWFDAVVGLGAVIAAALVFLLMFLTCYEIFIRYVFQNAPAWVMEISEYLLLYITFLGAPWLLKADAHVRVDLAYAFLTEKSVKGLKTATLAGAAAVAAFVAAYGAIVTWRYFEENLKVIQTLRVPKWIILIIIPVGCFMLCIQLLRQMFDDFSRGGTRETKPAPK
jgi:C4-dicarboxylate transporter, DctQ subunit